jgi:hypothetical protein
MINDGSPEQSGRRGGLKLKGSLQVVVLKATALGSPRRRQTSFSLHCVVGGLYSQ